MRVRVQRERVDLLAGEAVPVSDVLSRLDHGAVGVLPKELRVCGATGSGPEGVEHGLRPTRSE